MKNLQQLKGITIATVFFFGLLYVQAWTGAPAGTPPANNVDAPVNVGDSTQYKSGSLGVGGLLKAYSTFNIPTGAGLGKVLISDATGNASWTPVSSLGVVTSISGGSCAVGQVVKSISSSGVVTCVADAGGSAISGSVVAGCGGSSPYNGGPFTVKCWGGATSWTCPSGSTLFTMMTVSTNTAGEGITVAGTNSSGPTYICIKN